MQNILSKSEIEKNLKQLNGWEFRDNKIRKTFHFRSFRDAMYFLIRLSYEAEEQNHHPEILNCYNQVEVFLNTHDANNKVTHKDFKLANLIDQVA